MSHNTVGVAAALNSSMLPYRPGIVAHVGLSGQREACVRLRSVDTHIATREGRNRRFVHRDGLRSGSRIGTTVLVLVVHRNRLGSSAIPLQGNGIIGRSTSAHQSSVVTITPYIVAHAAFRSQGQLSIGGGSVVADTDIILATDGGLRIRINRHRIFGGVRISTVVGIGVVHRYRLLTGGSPFHGYGISAVSTED